MDKLDKKVCAAVLAPFAGALLFGLYYAVTGVEFMFSKEYGLGAFIMGAIGGFIVTLAADIFFLIAASIIKRVKRSAHRKTK